MSLSEFLYPPDDVIEALNDLDKYFQFINQKDVQVFIAKGRKTRYEGTLGELGRLKDMEEYFDLTQGKLWDSLTRIIYLIDSFTTSYNLANLVNVDPDVVKDLIDIIQKGVQAHKKLVEWIAPLKKKDVLTALYDATKVTIGGDRSTFEVLDLGEIDMEETENPVLYPYLLRIQNPDQLIQYFKYTDDKPKTSLIVTYQLHRDPEKDFKSGFYLFFLYGGHIYSVSNAERRYNIDNTAGMRNPDKYIDRKYRHTWLPVKAMLQGDPTKQEILIPDSSVYIAETFENIEKETPEIVYWLAIFMLRVKEYVDTTNEIVRGITPYDAQLLLEDFNTRDDREFTEHRSQASSSDYLVKAYGEKIKDIVVSDAILPPMIAPRERIINVIRWERRKVLAKSVREMVFDDYRKNFTKAMKWLKEFVMKHDYEEILTKALLDDVYPRMFYHPTFSGYVYGEEAWEYKTLGWGSSHDHAELVEVPAIFYEKILRDGISGFVVGGRYVNEFNWAHEDGMLEWRNDNQYHTKCPNCGKNPWKTILQLTFKDYRQICAFFNVPPACLPEWVVTHLHQQNETYSGNSILDDTDPMDAINSPWFREHETKPRFIVTTPYGVTYRPHFSFYMPVCVWCRRRVEKKLGIVREKEAKEPKEPPRVITMRQINAKKNGWSYKSSYAWDHSKRHFYVNKQSLCNRSYIKGSKTPKPDKKDDHWDNCKMCIRTLNKIRKERKK